MDNREIKTKLDEYLSFLKKEREKLDINDVECRELLREIAEIQYEINGFTSVKVVCLQCGDTVECVNVKGKCFDCE